MELVSGGLNGTFLQEIAELAHTKGKCKHVQAAIAYASGQPKLFSFCKHYKAKLDFWCRHDHTVPVSISLLEDFISTKSPNYNCRLVPDIFHAKVIWWHGYGSYIGSANLTERGWFSNIEAGIFIEEEEFIGRPFQSELEQFFIDVNSKSYPLTTEVINELKQIQKDRQEIEKIDDRIKADYAKKRKLPVNPPLTSVNRKSALSYRRDKFLKEWYQTLQELRNIGHRLSEEYRPSWINTSVPLGVHTDRFMHAYYDEFAKDGNKSIHEELYEKNHENPEAALIHAMSWWRDLAEAPRHVYERVNVSAPKLREKLQEEEVLNLSLQDFTEICSLIFAIHDHSLRVSYKSYGLDTPLPSMDSNERVKFLAEWLYKKKTQTNLGTLEVLRYVLYGGPIDNVPERIWDSHASDHYNIPHLGISAVGEIVGWALPDIFPPRNGRTSKALKSLGYNVTIHSD